MARLNFQPLRIKDSVRVTH